MDMRIEMARIMIFGVGWAIFLCLLAMFTNVMRWLDDQPPYELHLGHFFATWLVLWGCHSIIGLMKAA